MASPDVTRFHLPQYHDLGLFQWRRTLGAPVGNIHSLSRLGVRYD